MPTDDDRTAIDRLIRDWVDAVRAGDIEGVLAGHADDIVMFDVPPPYAGVRGLADYRATWPDFFAWQAQGAEFTLESLDVTAGGDVAFAYALLRCGTPADFAAKPDLRLRLTVGLHKRDGRWQVTHEHHSFADDSLTAQPEAAA